VIDRLTPDLLGRHVVRRTDDRARLCVPERLRLVPVDDDFFVAGIGRLDQAEVEDLDAAVGIDEDVLRLEVAVDEPLPVRGGESVGDLHRDVERLPRRQSTLDSRSQRLSLEELHDQVGDGDALPAVFDRGLADVEEGADVRMAERGDRARLAAKTLGEIADADAVRRQHLDGHNASKAGVAGAIHLPHPARADLREKLVRPEHRPCGKTHVDWATS
jgi:hypothetical protein